LPEEAATTHDVSCWS